MKIDWSSYRITLLLYLAVLILPLGFYFSYNSFSKLQSNAKVLNTFTLNSASMLTLDSIKDPLQKEKKRKAIDLIFQKLRPWMQENNKEVFYIGSEPLLKKYDNLLLCWNKSQGAYEEKGLQKCYKQAKTIVFSLNNMTKLQQNKIYNIFYINLFVSVALLMTLIFFTRVFIYKQLRKHSIYDLESQLFSKDYLLSTLKEVSARMKRTYEPLSVLYIDVEELQDDKYNSKKEKNSLVTHIGSSFLETLRDSDIACRYSESEFVIILPNTTSLNVKHITDRLDHSLNNIRYTIKVIEHKKDETYEEFLMRVV